MYDVLDITPESMTAEDLDEVLSIETVSFPTPWSRQMFLDELAHRHSRLIVFRASRQIVGYMCFWQVLDEAHLFNIAVADTKRGRGIGLKIMQYLDEICRRNGMNRIILEVARRNSAARALYKKAGFSSIGFRKKYYAVVDDDALVMEKWLGNQTESATHNSEEIAL
jgi:ribosomal-protein-alanine N-acetyltransferase